MNLNILYIGVKITKVAFGGEQVNYRNQRLLEEIQGSSLTYLEPRWTGREANYRLQITNVFWKNIVTTIEQGNFTHVFVAHSLSGRAIKKIKKRYPHLKIITFFHNVEYKYAKDLVHSTGKRYFSFFLPVKYWEKQAVKYTDKIISLNQRDSDMLFDIYGRKADLILPTAFEDRFDRQQMQSHICDIDYLFVGVNFYANVDGVNWFIDNVLPKVPGVLHVIGSDMEKADLHTHDRMIVHGYVEDLSSFYYRSKVVVAPIFLGSGMKTKVADALMYGRLILGTKEAFQGYDIDPRSMKLCDNTEDFIACINALPNETFFECSRDVFSRTHNMNTQLPQMLSIFE